MRLTSARVAVNAVPLGPGGGLTYLVNQAEHFGKVAPQWTFTYFASPRNFAALRAVIPVEQLIVPFDKHPPYARRVRWEQSTFFALLRSRHFDLAYLPGNYAIFRSPIPQVVVDHNPLHHATLRQLQSRPLWIRARLLRLVARATARRAESVIYLSEAFRREMKAVGFPDPDRVIPSGVSLDWHAARRNVGEAQFPETLTCAQCREGSYALAVHNWYPHKRLQWLCEAWLSEPTLRGMHLVLVGDGPGELLDTFRRRSPSLHVLGGSLSRAEIADLYARAAVFISASVLEAFPLTPFEAMSFGVPCVLSDIGAHLEVAGDAAFYFQCGSAPALVNAIFAAMDANGEVRERMKAQLGRFSWRTNAELMIEEFERVLDTADKRSQI